MQLVAAIKDATKGSGRTFIKLERKKNYKSEKGGINKT